MKSVTTALRETIKEVTGSTNKLWIWSDPRKPANLTPGYKAVGVKVTSFRPDPVTVGRILTRMQEKGYHFHYARNSNWKGMRFCFSAPACPVHTSACPVHTCKID